MVRDQWNRSWFAKVLVITVVPVEGFKKAKAVFDLKKTGRTAR
jgi:hypothetical protein